MIFLFEQFAYSTEYLKKVLPTDKQGRFKDLPNGFVARDGKLDGVGYVYNAGSERDGSDKITFVLPKVFLDENGTKAFGEDVPAGEDFELKNAPKDFLSNLSMWVCSSIGQYREKNPDDKSMEAPDARGFCSDSATPTLIDVMNAMVRFYEENKALFVFVSKNVHSGNNRIDWRRTMRKLPILQGESGSGAGMTNGGSGTTPIYMELENKKKVFDLDDRLLVLYFSAMNYIGEIFGFKMPKSEFYAPMRVNEFRRLLGHRGLVELRRIKHKYFADKFLRLYNIMKAFFEWGAKFSACSFESEYLLTSKYNNVFEAMIDELIGDKNIPILGINCGHLGFLADVQTRDVDKIMRRLIQGKYTLEQRSVLALTCSEGGHISLPFALNEVAVMKQALSSMITIETLVNGQPLHTYEADGLVIATPTGSTAYNLSIGGPLMVPQTRGILLSPIATHSLNVRPLVIPDDWKIDLRVRSRNGNYLISVDGRSQIFTDDVTLHIERAPYTVKLVQIGEHSFLKSLKDKLLWGAN